jgi:hypothetical protein
MPDAEKHYENDDESYAPGPYERTYERPKGLKGLYQHPTTQVCMLGEYSQINIRFSPVSL